MELQTTWQPGRNGIELDPALFTAVKLVAETMVPGDEEYPSATRARVASFVESRINANELVVFQSVLADVDEMTDVTTWLTNLETENPAAFGLLRFYVFAGYYSSRLFLETLARQGHEYHGAPQPYGYEIDEPMPIPSGTRGSYIHESEVTNVFGNV